MISQGCRNCENWSEKDWFYVVGTVSGTHIAQLSFVYGFDYAADRSVYEKIRETVKQGILEVSNLDFSETKELGRVNKVDPLGITYLRIRGMWGIENPLKVFSSIYQPNSSESFNMFAVINDEKYRSFEFSSRSLIENDTVLKITDVKIKDPNNPARLKSAKLIRL